MKVCVILGTRPQFIELAPIIHELKQFRNVKTLVYNTDQHYDISMSEIFFQELKIPTPDKSLGVRPGTHAQQTGRIMMSIEREFLSDRPDGVVVEGDTNTALGAALAAAKLKIPTVHVEAGCRIFDKSLPEELNRVLISHCSSLHIAPTENCRMNLIREGISTEKILRLGHPLVDAIEFVREKLDSFTGHMIGDIAPVKRRNFYYVTVHRDHNVDDKARLSSILRHLDQLAKRDKNRPVIFPLHPRTKKRINQFGLSFLLHNLQISEPVGFITSLSLVRNAFMTITDSGGVTKESAILGTPCVILRSRTEWIETLQCAFAQLAFAEGNSIAKCVSYVQKNHANLLDLKGLRDIFGLPGVSRKIARAICSGDLHFE